MSTATMNPAFEREIINFDGLVNSYLTRLVRRYSQTRADLDEQLTELRKQHRQAIEAIEKVGSTLGMTPGMPELILELEKKDQLIPRLRSLLESYSSRIPAFISSFLMRFSSRRKAIYEAADLLDDILDAYEDLLESAIMITDPRFRKLLNLVEPANV